MVYAGAFSVMNRRRSTRAPLSYPNYGHGAGAMVPGLVRNSTSRFPRIGLGTGRRTYHPLIHSRLNQGLAPRFARQTARASLHVRNARLRNNRR